MYDIPCLEFKKDLASCVMHTNGILESECGDHSKPCHVIALLFQHKCGSLCIGMEQDWILKCKFSNFLNNDHKKIHAERTINFIEVINYLSKIKMRLFLHCQALTKHINNETFYLLIIQNNTFKYTCFTTIDNINAAL